MQKNTIRTIVGGAIALIMALGLTSCGSSHENLVKKQIDAMNEYADEFAKDPKSSKLAKIDEALTEIAEKMDKMGEPSKSKAEKLASKYGADLLAAGQRYAQAKMGSVMGEGLGEMLKGLPEGLPKGLGEAIKK